MRLSNASSQKLRTDTNPDSKQSPSYLKINNPLANSNSSSSSYNELKLVAVDGKGVRTHPDYENVKSDEPMRNPSFKDGVLYYNEAYEKSSRSPPNQKQNKQMKYANPLFQQEEKNPIASVTGSKLPKKRGMRLKKSSN
jgi:hypothetical protein